MGVMEVSAPKVKSPMPTQIITAPMRKQSIRSVGMGTMVWPRRMTMHKMGSTETVDSPDFFADNQMFFVKNGWNDDSGLLSCENAAINNLL